MTRSDRIASLLLVPLVLIVGLLVFNEYREQSRPVTSTDSTIPTGDFFGVSSSATPGSDASSSGASTTSTTGGSATTSTNDESSTEGTDLDPPG